MEKPISSSKPLTLVMSCLLSSIFEREGDEYVEKRKQKLCVEHDLTRKEGFCLADVVNVISTFTNKHVLYLVEEEVFIFYDTKEECLAFFQEDEIIKQDISDGLYYVSEDAYDYIFENLEG